MIRTPICDLLDIQHPTALGGMGSASSTANDSGRIANTAPSFD